MSSLLIKNGTIITADGESQMDIFIKNGFIAEMNEETKKRRNESATTTIIDATGLLIMPGLIDCHVHFREPGLEQKETMATGCAAALAGGVTTVCEMPNTIPPVVTIAALADKVRRAEELRIKNKELRFDMRFFFGATEMAHLQTLRELWTGTSDELQRLKKSCCGLKLYLDHSTGDQKAPHGVIDEAFRMCGELGIVVVCHCEDAEMNATLQRGSSTRNIDEHSKMRPPESEAKAIEYALGLAKKYDTHLHVAHLSTKQGIDLVRAAKKSGITVTCEVAPHHLFMTVEDYASLGTLAKMNPPLRAREHQIALWEGIADGTVDCIATDHAPHTLEEKGVTLSPSTALRTGSAKSDWREAPSGVPGVETMVPLLLSVTNGKLIPRQAQEENGKLFSILNSQFSINDILRLCFTNPNRIFNLGKQGIVEGAPADLILVDVKKEWVVRGKELGSKCGWTVYEGWIIRGKVVPMLSL